MKTTIKTIQDIQKLVDNFYAKVRKDELLAPVFNQVIKEDWSAHLEKMYRFWQTILLDEHTYYGSPFRPHAKLPIEKKHFKRWLTLFEETLAEDFEGATAEEALWRANKMAEMFQFKIEYHRNHNTNPLL